MFVLLGPDFEGSQDAYGTLARITGLVAYDLKARVRPGAWGVLKALGDAEQAEALASQLSAAGFRAVLVDRLVAHDPERRIVHARGLTLREADFALHFTERDMAIEYAALGSIVRGEVQPGRMAQRSSAGSSSSSPTFRAVVPTSDPPARDAHPMPFESYHAADLHFLMAPWFARIDVRAVGTVGEASVRALDKLVDELAARARVRVDRSMRTSSVASFAEQSARAKSEPPGRKELPDERFDPYSRLIAEAERRWRALGV